MCDIEILIKEAHSIRNNSKILREDSNNIKKLSNATRNGIKILIKEAHAIKNNSKKYFMSKNNNILSRDVLHAKIKNTHDNIEKDMQLIKKDSYLIKKSLNSHIEDVCNIKRDSYYNKKSVNYLKKNICNIKREISHIEKTINYRKKKICAIKLVKSTDITKKELDKSITKICSISGKLSNTNKELNLVRKRVHANRDNVIYAAYTMCYTKVCLQIVKNQLNLSIKEINDIEKSTPVKTDTFVRVQKNYMLLTKDMEIILKKLLYDQFLDRKFSGKRLGENKIKLVSPNKKIKSKIKIDNNGVSVNFRKIDDLIKCCSQINMNTHSIMIENIYCEIEHHAKEIINKMSYTGITNDKNNNLFNI